MSLPKASDFEKIKSISAFGGIERVSRKHGKSGMKYYRKRIDVKDKDFFYYHLAFTREKLTAHVKSLGRTAIYFPVITERKDKKWTVIGITREAADRIRFAVILRSCMSFSSEPLVVGGYYGVQTITAPLFIRKSPVGCVDLHRFGSGESSSGTYFDLSLDGNMEAACRKVRKAVRAAILSVEWIFGLYVQAVNGKRLRIRRRACVLVEVPPRATDMLATSRGRVEVLQCRRHAKPKGGAEYA
ncbi:hypothetical protein DFH11DRAFT_1741650 [Phellopilus nigrolimitatus]|nr:hypothetical protein DFH11DRAFT_1741650 [Phellopilus nigrolimitatus]